MEICGTIVIEVQYGEILRCFSANVVDLSIGVLTEKILALFKFGPDEEMILTFTDKDGDSVVVADDEDLLTEMVKQQHSPNHTLRIDVKLNNGKARNFLPPSPAGRFGDTYQPHLHSMDNRGSQGPQVQPKLHNSAMLDYIGQFTIIVEQIDNGKQLTRNRKFLTVVPLVLGSKDDQPVAFRTAAAKSVYQWIVKPQTIIKTNEMFLPGRMSFIFNMENGFSHDIPTTMHRSKADCPVPEEMVTVSVDVSVLYRIAKIMSYLRLGSSGKVLKKKKKDKDAKGKPSTVSNGYDEDEKLSKSDLQKNQNGREILPPPPPPPRKNHIEQVAGWGADGVIVGSAMVKLLGEAKDPKEGLKELELFTKNLKFALLCFSLNISCIYDYYSCFSLNI